MRDECRDVIRSIISSRHAFSVTIGNSGFFWIIHFCPLSLTLHKGDRHLKTNLSTSHTVPT